MWHNRRGPPRQPRLGGARAGAAAPGQLQLGPGQAAAPGEHPRRGCNRECHRARGPVPDLLSSSRQRSLLRQSSPVQCKGEDGVREDLGEESSDGAGRGEGHIPADLTSELHCRTRRRGRGGTLGRRRRGVGGRPPRTMCRPVGCKGGRGAWQQ